MPTGIATPLGGRSGLRSKNPAAALLKAFAKNLRKRSQLQRLRDDVAIAARAAGVLDLFEPVLDRLFAADRAWNSPPEGLHDMLTWTSRHGFRDGGHAFTARKACLERLGELAPRLEGTDPEKGNPSPRRSTRRERTADWLARAMLTVHDHPEWSDRAIAAHVGVHGSQLSRNSNYRAAAALAKSASPKRGMLAHGAGASGLRLEAIDDSLDPNRRPSRQNADEEDTDDRLDREINDRNAKRNADHPTLR